MTRCPLLDAYELLEGISSRIDPECYIKFEINKGRDELIIVIDAMIGNKIFRSGKSVDSADLMSGGGYGDYIIEAMCAKFNHDYAIAKEKHLNENSNTNNV